MYKLLFYNGTNHCLCVINYGHEASIHIIIMEHLVSVSNMEHLYIIALFPVIQ